MSNLSNLNMNNDQAPNNTPSLFGSNQVPSNSNSLFANSNYPPNFNSNFNSFFQTSTGFNLNHSSGGDLSVGRSFLKSKSETSSLILNLDWALKQKLVNYLEKLNQIFLGKIVSKKDELTDENNKLILQLINLPIRSNVENRFILAISWQTREKVISNLISNYNFAILNNDSIIITNDAKKEQVIENSQWIQYLLNLQVTNSAFENSHIKSDLGSCFLINFNN